MARNVYVTDLDGTLLNSKSVLSDFTRNKLNQLIKEDILVLFASARGGGSMKYVLEGVELKYPLIECNGAYITSHESSEHIGINEIEKNQAERVIDIFSEYGLDPMISSNHITGDRINYTSYSNEVMAKFFEVKLSEGDKRITKVHSLKEVLNDRVVSFNFIGKYNLLCEINERLKAECNGISSVIVDDHLFDGWYWLMINSKKATKGSGIKLLLNHLGIKDYHLTVFGDNFNDLSMFEIADKSVAMGNGTKVLQNEADEIIGASDEDSVVKYILEREMIK